MHARVDAAMDAAEISDLAERVPHQLSYGQRKRVALAGALAMRPEVLLLDEPTAGLDPAGGRQLLRTLERLHEQGTAVVLSTHDVNLAYAFSETAAVIHDGQVVVGPKEDILGDAALMRTARLELPWAPAVSAALGRVVSRPEELIEGARWDQRKNPRSMFTPGIYCGQSRDRTGDLPLFRRTLYRLSYLAVTKNVTRP